MSLHTLSAIELRDKFLKKELSAKEICSHFFARIHRFDPAIQSFLTLCEERAYRQAELLDNEKAPDGKLHGKLAGIPIAVKDNIHVEGITSSAGSKILQGYIAPFSATATRLLEEEGAIIIGKTNCDEFAMGSSTENSGYFPTKNPWNLERTPGGSSGGSAAAVAARLVPIALGSDTGGSIRQPASFCGIAGLKPTYGRISRHGLIAYGSSLDQIGPMAHGIKDIALAQEIMGRACARDATSIQKPQESIVEALSDPGLSLKGKKIGVATSFTDALAKEPMAVFQNSLSILTSLGAEIVEIDLSLLRYCLATYYIIACAEASTNLARYDGIRYGHRSPLAKTLEEVYSLSKEEGFGQEVKRRILLGTFVLSKGYQDAFYTKAQKVRAKISAQYQAAFEKCDLIVSPTTPFSAFKIGSIQDPLQMYLEDIYTISVNLAGLPALSIPAGFSKEGLPIGVQYIAPHCKEKELLTSAYAFEKAVGPLSTTPENTRL